MFVRSTVVWMAVCVTAAVVAVSSSRLEAQGRRTAEGVAEVLYEDSADGGRLVHFLNTGTERIRLKTGPQHRHLKTGYPHPCARRDAGWGAGAGSGWGQ